jgi:protein required for attachment to host cells
MSRPLNLIFLIADGAHARLVARTETGDFAAFKELNDHGGLKHMRDVVRRSPAGRSVESVGGARHAVGPEDVLIEAKETFARSAAEEACRQVRDRRAGGLILVAPARLLPVLRHAAEGKVPVVAALAKDLTKTPADKLHSWLTPLELEAQAPAAER